MADWTETDITTKVSPRSVTNTVSRLTGILVREGPEDLRRDRPERRSEPGRMRLRETTLVPFGNPAAGTP